MKGKPVKKITARELVIEMLQRTHVGPIFQSNDSEVFRLAVGSFFASMEIGEYASMLEDQADDILKRAEGGKTRCRKKKCEKGKYST